MAGWVKRLRQKLRNRRPALILASFILLVLMVLGISWYLNQQNEQVAKEVLAQQKWEVIIQNKYLVGPMVEEKKVFSAKEMSQFNQHIKNLILVKEEQGRYTYEKKINDLSPVLKKKGLLSVDRYGMLTLYEGNPEENNVIQTFFQIDLERLETTLPTEDMIQLHKGIRFSSIAEFNSILSTYGEYAVMSPEEEGKEIR